MDPEVQAAQRALDEQTGWSDAFNDDGTVRNKEAAQRWLSR